MLNFSGRDDRIEEILRNVVMAIKTLDRHIEVTRGIMGGKARIAGHRITVQSIAIWHERLGKIADENDLSLGEVYAALSDNRDEIDANIAEGEAFPEDMRKSVPSKLKAKLEKRSG
jgi:uncharacterized protein (DUF433 family)